METNATMSAGQSLELIKKVIEGNRREMQRGMAGMMFIWGAVVAVTALVVGHLWMHNGGPVWNWLWLSVPVVGNVAMWLYERKSEKRPAGFVGKVLGYVWASFAVGCFTLFALYVLSFDAGSGLRQIPITSMIIVLMTVSCIATGLVVGNKFIIPFSAAPGVVLSYFALMYQGPYEMLAMALAALLMLVLPGLMIYWKTKKI